MFKFQNKGHKNMRTVILGFNLLAREKQMCGHSDLCSVLAILLGSFGPIGSEEKSVSLMFNFTCLICFFPRLVFCSHMVLQNVTKAKTKVRSKKDNVAGDVCSL